MSIATGDLVEEQILAPELHQLSMSITSRLPRDTVFGCQYRGPEADAPPLLGHRRGTRPVIVPAPTTRRRRSRTISARCRQTRRRHRCFGAEGRVITYWDIGSRRFLGSCG
jgi:hypothetical protein